MNLFRTSILNGMAVGIRTLSMLALNKILAVAVGPSGYALMGQFQNAVNVMFVLASGAINNGVTTYTAASHDDGERQRLVWRTAVAIALAGGLLIATLVAIWHRTLSRLFLGTEVYGDVFLWFAGALVLFVLNALLLAILNGKKEVGRYVAANIGGSLLTLVVTGLLAMRYGIRGALIALAVNQSVAFFVTLTFCWRASWFSLSSLFGRIDWGIARDLGKFALMALTAATVTPASYIVVRNYLGGAFSWEDAGYWEAMMRVSGIATTLAGATFSVYYLPRVAEIRDPAVLRREVLRVGALVLSFSIVAAGSMYLLRDVLIRLLFDDSFAPMAGLFAWQVTGDVLRMGSWLMAYLLIAHARTKSYMIAEISAAALLIGLTVMLCGRYGFYAASLAYALTSAAYLMLVMLFTRLSRVL